jgi:DnaJ-class molecular chaperone
VKYLYVYEDCEACGGVGRVGGRPGVGPCMKCDGRGRIEKRVSLLDFYKCVRDAIEGIGCDAL